MFTIPGVCHVQRLPVQRLCQVQLLPSGEIPRQALVILQEAGWRVRRCGLCVTPWLRGRSLVRFVAALHQKSEALLRKNMLKQSMFWFFSKSRHLLRCKLFTCSMIRVPFWTCICSWHGDANKMVSMEDVNIVFRRWCLQKTYERRLRALQLLCARRRRQHTSEVRAQITTSGYRSTVITVISARLLCDWYTMIYRMIMQFGQLQDMLTLGYDATVVTLTALRHLLTRKATGLRFFVWLIYRLYPGSEKDPEKRSK